MRNVSFINGLKLALIGLCGLAAQSCKQAPEAKTDNEYQVLEITLSNKTLSSSFSAKISGKQDVEIRPRISGTITEVCIAEGSIVKKGQTLFIIDPVPYQTALQTAIANVETAQANVATAELTADSKQELYAQNVVSAYDLQTAQNNLRAQKAALSQTKAQEASARNDLSYTSIKSPSDGVVGMIAYRVGALVSSSITTPLVTVSDDSDMLVYFSMTENQVLALSRKNGSMTNTMQAMPPVQLQLSDGTLYNETGTIDAISGIIDATTGAIRIRAAFPNKDRILRSGGSGNIVLPYQKQNSIVIPQGATYEIQDKLFVYKVTGGKAISTPVTAFEINDGKEYVIESGLNPGDTIVAEGAGLLHDGAPVTAKTATTQP